MGLFEGLDTRVSNCHKEYIFDLSHVKWGHIRRASNIVDGGIEYILKKHFPSPTVSEACIIKGLKDYVLPTNLESFEEYKKRVIEAVGIKNKNNPLLNRLISKNYQGKITLSSGDSPMRGKLTITPRINEDRFKVKIKVDFGIDYVKYFSMWTDLSKYISERLSNESIDFKEQVK